MKKRMLHMAMALLAILGSAVQADDLFLLPYFLGNGETGVYFAYSRDGLEFQWLNDGKVVMPAPSWKEESLTRDPSIIFHEGIFHMVWTTSWNSRSIGYAHSKDLVDWSEPEKIDIWGEFTAVKNTWAPELHWDPEQKEFLILWSSTTLAELEDADGSVDPHGNDHRTYAARTKDFKSFSKPALFFSPQNPEYGVIDPYIAHDDRGTTEVADDRWVMVIKNEMASEHGGKNLRLTFSKRMQGPFETTLGPPVVGAGTDVVDTMGEGPSLLKHHGLWFLYWDAPGSKFSYCLATSKDLKTWKNRSQEMSLPAKQMRHGTVLVVPEAAVALLATDVRWETTYRVTLTVTSDLPSSNVPMDPTIDFGKLIVDAKLPGVLDPNSIALFNKATGQAVLFARNEDFAYGDRGRLEWVITDPTHKTFEIRFRTALKRPQLKPQVDTPLVGVGELLRYNAKQPRPITLFYSAALADLNGDGDQDLIGCWNYAYRPGDPWSGVICYPGVGDSDTPEFGDLVRLQYAKTPVATSLHKFSGGPYVACALADFNKDGKIDLVYSGSGEATFYINTGRRDPGGMPIFAPSQSMKVTKWNACQVVDLDGDGVLDLIIDGQYIRNQNRNGWPFQPAKEMTLDAGNQPCFLDLDHDGRFDAVTLEDAPGEGLSNYRIVWRRNLGTAVPSFGPAKVLTDINSQVTRPRGLAAVRSGSTQGVLVQHDDYQAVSFYELVSQRGEKPRFEHRYRAGSLSAVMSLSDQAWPCVCDWDADGDMDLLVGGGYGWPRIVINEGTATRPAFAEPKLILSNGKPIRLLRDEILGSPKNWHNMGYVYPVLIDWDGDALPDLVCPNETNRIFWYRNVGSRREPKFGKRRQIICDGFPDSPELRILSAQRAKDKNSSNGVYPYEEERPFMWRTGAALADFNGDGLMDLVTHDGHTRVATLFVQYRDSEGELRLRKDSVLKLADGREIDDSIVGRRSHWTESFRAVDWDGDGLMDIVYSFAGSQGGIQDNGSIYLLRNCGTKSSPIFENPTTMRCFGEPIRITAHGPHPWPGDFDDDGKPDLLACVEWSVYPFYRHAALTMKKRPQFTLGPLQISKELVP